MKNIMNNEYWNSLAENYTDQVIEIAQYDLKGVLKEEVELISKTADTAADLGCGPGRLLELLSPHFKEVKAVDYASDLLKRAQERYNFTNVEYIQHNLAGTKPLEFKADVTFCINVMITPVFEQRVQIARNVWEATKKNGLSVFVVPAFESVLHVYQTLVNCQINEGATRKKSLSRIERLFQKEVTSMIDGIVSLGGTPTKCYTQEKLTLFLSEMGYKPIRLRKIEYNWKEEIENVPAELGAPYPWDWFVLARKE